MNDFFTVFIKSAVAFIFFFSLLACGGAEERKAKYLEKGKTYLSDKNYEKARVEIKNVIQIDPKDPEAHFLMGRLEELNKEYAKAIGFYRKSIEISPEYTDPKVKLARIYVIAGSKDHINEANKLLAEVKQVDPDNTEVDLILATIDFKSGLKEKAISSLEKVVSKNGGLVEGVSLLSALYLATQEQDKAMSLLLKSVVENPDNVSLRVSLAKLYSANKNYTEAEKYLIEAISIDPENYKLQIALSSFYSTSNQLDKAESVLRESIEQNDDDVKRYLVLFEFLSSQVSIQEAEDEISKAISKKPDLYALKFSLVKFYEKVGKRDKAIKTLKTIISDKKYDVEGVTARIQLARNLLEIGDKKGAKDNVNQVIEEYPNNNDALLISSKLALDNFDSIAAINGLRTVIQNNPKNTEASMLLAKAHELSDESSLAENVLKKSIESNPTSVRSHVNYAGYLSSKGRNEEALNVIEKASIYFKDNYDLMVLKLKIYTSSGKPASEILALLDVMEKAKSAEPNVNLIRGRYFLSNKRNDEAIKQFEKAYNKSRNKYESLELIVKTHLLNKQPEKALKRLQSVLDQSPDDPVANQLAGQVFLAQKNVRDARIKFRQSSKKSDQWLLPYTSLASTYIFENDLDSAIKVYENAISNLKFKTQAKIHLATIYQRKQDFSKAMGLYEQILLTNPDNKLAANNFASLLLDHGNKKDIKKALELSKGFAMIKRPALQDTLAWAYAKSGDNTKAIEILKPVVEKSPKIAVFRYHLGYALYHTGDKAAAKSHLDIAASSEQIFTGKDTVKELLKTI